ncbi:MAG: cryptochrome/photolyase family protein [Pseudomonadota bacterium]|jgi:deoxyribodipyrimidine photo-lyase
MTAIWWIRRDLRLADNPALAAALLHGPVIPLYIHAPDEEGEAAPGAASRWWLHHSLAALDGQLRALGSRLIVRRAASAQAALRAVAAATGAEAVFWNRQYAPAQIARDQSVKAALRGLGLRAESFNGSLLFEPWEVLTREGKPYRIFTPYWKACQGHGLDRVDPIVPPSALPPVPREVGSEPLESLRLLPEIPWDTGFHDHWTPGEEGAWRRLRQFIGDGLAGYSAARDRPGHAGTSRLSPHLHFGELGPRQVVRAVLEAQQGDPDADARRFFSELGWREFAHHILFHFPHTVGRPMNPRWEGFLQGQEADPRLWQAWTRGQTGIPLVDAGMRELWQTGWMHNRVRMIVASMLTKNMQIGWQQGERWFWDTLVDADLANNVFGWQWTAGCGADAAPYFRIFNPVLQGERFDGEGDYVRRWVPELARLPGRWLHRPWEAPAQVLRAAGITLGTDYPHPVVDLAASRQRALDAFVHLV